LEEVKAEAGDAPSTKFSDPTTNNEISIVQLKSQASLEDKIAKVSITNTKS